MLYFLVDPYTLEVMDTASTQRLAYEKYDALVEETGGLHIWQIIQARNRKELNEGLYRLKSCLNFIDII